MSSPPSPPYRLKPYKGLSQLLRTLRQSNERLAREVESILLDLAYDPYPPTAEELRDNYAGIWKIKVDGWRILYQVDEQDRVVKIVNVKRRDRDTYRKLT